MSLMEKVCFCLSDSDIFVLLPALPIVGSATLHPL